VGGVRVEYRWSAGGVQMEYGCGGSAGATEEGCDGCGGIEFSIAGMAENNAGRPHKITQQKQAARLAPEPTPTPTPIPTLSLGVHIKALELAARSRGVAGAVQQRTQALQPLGGGAARAGSRGREGRSRAGKQAGGEARQGVPCHLWHAMLSMRVSSLQRTGR